MLDLWYNWRHIIMFDWSSKKRVVAGTILPEFTAPIDFVLDEELVLSIYDTWDEEAYGQLVDFGGGVKAITASMLKNAGSDFLEQIRGIGPKKAASIISDIEVVIAEVPYL
jgi:hypothetical protein